MQYIVIISLHLCLFSLLFVRTPSIYRMYVYSYILKHNKIQSGQLFLLTVYMYVQCLRVPVFVCSMKVGDHKHGQNVFFHATGLSGDNNPSRGTNWKMRTLQKQREELGHSKVCIQACCPLKACSLHEMGLDVFGLFLQ